MFKVVTEDMKSLGLGPHTNIVTYPVGQILRHENPIVGIDDRGGYWVCHSLSGVRQIQKYMMSRYSRQTRVFAVEVENILFSNSYRAKVGTIRLVKEVFTCF